MTTTDTKNEYVTDVEHEKDCREWDDRTALYLARHIIQVQTAYFDEQDGESVINAGDDRQWEFDDQLKPLMLCCSSCAAFRYVAQDKHGDIIAINPGNCPRSSIAYGHFYNYDNKPCEYCGYVSVRSGGAS